MMRSILAQSMAGMASASSPFCAVNSYLRRDGSGKPNAVADPEARVSQIYREIARKTAAKLAMQAKSYASKFPNIVIQNN